MQTIARRQLLKSALFGAATFSFGAPAFAQSAAQPFEQWVGAFHAKAAAKGISDATYQRVMGNLKPDTSVFKEIRSQPEFNQQLWQYINRRVSDWRIQTGQDRLKEFAPLFARIEKDFGVERSVILGLWGIESTFGDPLVQQNHSRPVFPALAALAWGEPRRRAYWETELINAMRIVQKGWSDPKEMIGSWAGAMGHSQWMPEVWLNVGFDYDGDGKVNPFGRPDDALGSSARYLVNRGKYRRGEHWGYEVRAGGKATDETSRSYEAWQAQGVTRADGQPFPAPQLTAKLWVPVAGGPAFLLGPNFYAIKSYNPSNNYVLAIVHLGDRVMGGGPFIQPFPNSERAPTLAEVQEMQKRLTAAGYDTEGTDGRVGNATMLAARTFQQKAGMTPADGYLGLKLLAKLRGG
jgi:membrane-bound lytic murein transglycosylase B